MNSDSWLHNMTVEWSASIVFKCEIMCSVVKLNICSLNPLLLMYVGYYAHNFHNPRSSLYPSSCAPFFFFIIKLCSETHSGESKDTIDGRTLHSLPLPWSVHKERRFQKRFPLKYPLDLVHYKGFFQPQSQPLFSGGSGFGFEKSPSLNQHPLEAKR